VFHRRNRAIANKREGAGGKRTGFNTGDPRGLDCSRFIAPRAPLPQGELF